jgi:sulfite reductase (NADPH) flavoprotein alpha-component
MIQVNKKTKIHLFWVGRTKKSLALYDAYIATTLKNKTLTSFQVAYSQEQKKYVQDLLENQTVLIAKLLKKKALCLFVGLLRCSWQ